MYVHVLSCVIIIVLCYARWGSICPLSLWMKALFVTVKMKITEQYFSLTGSNVRGFNRKETLLKRVL